MTKKTKRVLTIINCVLLAGVLLVGCGEEVPAGSSSVEVSKKIEASETKIEAAKPKPIEVDVKKLPEGVTEADLTEVDDKYYLDQTEFKYLAKSAKKDLTVESPNGFSYTANAKGNMVTRIAVTEKAKEETQKQAEQKQKQNGTTPTSGSNQTVTGETTSNTGTASLTPSGGNSGTASSSNTANSGNTSGVSSGGNSGGSYVTPAQPTQPVHYHNWVAHTVTEDQGWYEDDYDYRPVCNVCGADLSGLDSMAQLDHLGNCKSGYSVVPVKVGQHWVSNPVTVIDYYYCTECGATK